jgi:hypothetical protein
MSDRTRSINIAIFTNALWLGGFPLETVIRSCRKSGATDAEIGRAMSLYASADFALQHCGIIERGAHLDRRATS